MNDVTRYECVGSFIDRHPDVKWAVMDAKIGSIGGAPFYAVELVRPLSQSAVIDMITWCKVNCTEDGNYEWASYSSRGLFFFKHEMATLQFFLTFG